MNNAFYLSFFAGLSTILGAMILFIRYKDEKLLIGKCLSFASGVMISVSVLDLIPEGFKELCNIFCVLPAIIIASIFIVIGFIVSSISNKIISTKDYMKENVLYKTGVFSMVAIMLHNIPEGIATFLTATTDLKLGISLAIAVAMHNIPEGISISIPIYYSTNSKIKSLIYTFIAGISEFFGAIIAYFLLKDVNIDLFLIFLYFIIGGIMISLAVEELIPTARKYINMFLIGVWFLIGFIFMAIIKTVF